MLDKNTLDKPIFNIGQNDFGRSVVFSAYLYFNAIFEFFGQIILQDAYIIFQQGTGKFEIEHKNANFWLGM